jgi:hypothetical protein
VSFGHFHGQLDFIKYLVKFKHFRTVNFYEVGTLDLSTGGFSSGCVLDQGEKKKILIHHISGAYFNVMSLPS